MIAVLSDTHRQADPGLTGRTATAVKSADIVVHAGDFVRAPVLDGFASVAEELHAVYGNVDDDAICARLPASRTLDVDGFTIAVTHKPTGGETGLALFGQERGADLVIFGHSHQPHYRWTGEIGLLNPGSHTRPRGHRPGHAELEIADAHLRGVLSEPDGTIFERFEIARNRT